MLSYQHAFHAGNFADILKHLVLCAALEYMTRKPAPLLYIDTHAGSGRYFLDDPRAAKTGEASQGILSLDLDLLENTASHEGSELVRLYRNSLSSFLEHRQYPGSPALAMNLLRRDDRLALYELHPAEFDLLSALVAGDRRIRAYRANGYTGVCLLPPVQKRALVLVDPPYERDEDYHQAAVCMIAAHKRMPSATLLLWYPVVQREKTLRLIDRLVKSGPRDLWLCELGLKADTHAHGMTASGMVMVNPPWRLPAQLEQLLPVLRSQLAPEHGHWTVECLVGERPV